MSILHEAYDALASPLLIGHRGLGTIATENTLEAIEAAHRQGADGIEIDVRPTSDGTLVLLHDPTLGRIAGGDRRRVASLSDRDLSEVRLPRGERVPTLEEALALARDLGLFVNVELKRDVPGRFETTRRLARLLRGRAEPAMVVASFDPVMLATFGRLAPDVPIALLFDADLAFVRYLVGTLGARAIHPARALVSAHQVAGWKKAGLRVMVWTVNDETEAAFLLSIGVDGIITDDPAALRPLFG